LPARILDIDLKVGMRVAEQHLHQGAIEPVI
jgi:hypothetical protein